MSLVDDGFREREIYTGGRRCIEVRVKGRERDVVGSMKGKKEARGQRWDTNAMAAHVDSTLSLFHAPYLPPPTLLTLPLCRRCLYTSFTKDILLL